MTLDFRHTYSALPSRFYVRVNPTPVPDPRLIVFNTRLAEDLGLDPKIFEPEAAAIFSGNRLPEDADPIAMAYAGHQFGHFVPQLGDGRAILLGESPDRSGLPRDIQLKGSGRTPYSRGGDGRAALGPVLREYLVSEAMHALGIPTTRSLAAVATGEQVFREGALPGAILTRVASSLVRVGTFEYFAARNDTEAVRQLADYVIERHYPHAKADEQPYLALLRAVIQGQASLIASWMHVGFIHGVMNTDNMAVSGETIDFGPCAFVDAYDPDKPEVKAFVAAYKKGTGKEPQNLHGYGYDGIHLIADAIRRAGSTDKEKIREAMQKTDYAGVMGKKGMKYTFPEGKRAGFDPDGMVVRVYEKDKQGRVVYVGQK